MTKAFQAKPPVILVTCEYPPFPGGIATYSGRIAETLRDGGISVHAITPDYPDMAGPVPAGIDQHRLFGHHSIPPRSIPRLLATLRAAPADAVLLAADIRAVMLLWLLRAFHRRQYRVMVHGSEASKLAGAGIMAATARRAYASAEMVLYNSAATRTIFRNSGVRPVREAVTYLGVDPSWFDPPPAGPFEHPELRQLAPDATLLCTVGRIEARKGHLEAVHAIARAGDLGNLVYIAAGRVETPQYRDDVVTAARQLGVALMLPGRLSDTDIKRLYHRSAAHLLCARAMPGRIEGFGLVLLEAAAQRCPSVATRVGGIPEVMGPTGFLANEGDTGALAAAIAHFVCDPVARDIVGTAAREHAARFSWAACAVASFPDIFHEAETPAMLSGHTPQDHAA